MSWIKRPGFFQKFDDFGYVIILLSHFLLPQRGPPDALWHIATSFVYTLSTLALFDPFDLYHLSRPGADPRLLASPALRVVPGSAVIDSWKEPSEITLSTSLRRSSSSPATIDGTRSSVLLSHRTNLCSAQRLAHLLCAVTACSTPSFRSLTSRASE